MKSTPIFAALILALLAVEVAATDLEPRRWTHLPVGMNVVGAGLMNNSSKIIFNPVLKLEDVKAKVRSAGISFLHAFDLFGQTARIDFRLPYISGRWEGLLNGKQASTQRRGFGDPRIRLSFNFLGAPALKGKDFRAYRVSNRIHTVAGVALAVTLPLGEYKRDKFINLGGNRFVVQPQLGIVHSRGPWSYELTGSVFLYTDNEEFFGGNKLEQDPLFAVQSHLAYTSAQGWWISTGAAYDWGGESKLNGVDSDDRKRDLFYGASAGYSITRTSSIKLAYIGTRTQTDVGSDNDRVVLGYSFRF